MPAPVPPPREWQSWNPCKPEIFLGTKIYREKNCISMTQQLEIVVQPIPCKFSIQQVAIASLSFLTDNVKYRVDQLSTFGVVPLHNTAVQHFINNMNQHDPTAKRAKKHLEFKIQKLRFRTRNRGHTLNECFLALAQLFPAPAQIMSNLMNAVSFNLWANHFKQNQNFQHNFRFKIVHTCLSEHKIVRAEQLSKWPGTNTVHGACGTEVMTS